MRKIAAILSVLLSCFTLLAQNASYDDRFIDAVVKYSSGDIDKAISELNILHAADSTDAAVIYYLAKCELEKKRTGSAISLLEEAATLDPSNVWYRSDLAGLLLLDGRYDDAVVYIEPLIEENPSKFNNPYMLSMVGNARMQQRLPAQARQFFERALTMDDSYIPAQFGVAQSSFVQRNYPVFFNSLNRIVGNPYLEPGAKCEFIGDILESIDAPFYWVWGGKINSLVDSLVTLHPDSYETHELKMQMCYIEQDTLGIIAQCEKMAEIALASNDRTKAARAITNIADLEYRQDNEKCAFKMYEYALKCDPDYAMALNNYAYYLSLKEKKLRKALKMSIKAVTLEPDNANYLDTHGWILHQLGKDEEAKPFFKHAMIYGGRDSKVVLEHYAEVLAALGDEETSAYYRRLAAMKE